MDKVRERIESLDRKDLVDFMERIVTILYWEDYDYGEGDHWNSQKECESGADFYVEVQAAVPGRVDDLVKHLTPFKARTETAPRDAITPETE